MTPDQLFEELSAETSVEKRQQLIENGLKSGISPSEITEMLDYLEVCATVKQRTVQGKNASTVSKKQTTFGAIWQSLVCPFRYR